MTISRRATTIAIVALALAVPAAARAEWNQPSGGPLDVSSGDRAEGPAIANIDGVPYVAWRESSGGHFQIFVKRLEGGAWVRVGGSLNVDPAQDANSPDITSVGGVPYAAWLETKGTGQELFVKRFTGTDWVTAGSGAIGAPNAAEPNIVSIGGVPYVTWDELSTTGHTLVFVARLIAGDWQPVGGPVNVSTVDDARTPRLADVGGVPYVVWREADGAHELIHVRRFNGVAFVPVGTDPLNLDATHLALEPSIAAVGGVPYVAWNESNGVAAQVLVKRFDGSDWTVVGDSLNVDPAQNASAPTIASIGGEPGVAWQEIAGRISQIRFARFDGTGWRAVGGPLNVDPSRDASFIVDPTLTEVGGVPYVTWFEANGASLDVRVKRLEPDILAESATPSTDSAVLTAEVNDFGVPLPVGFDYGLGALGLHTALQRSSGAGLSTISTTIGGLAPGTSYLFRAFGSDTFRETVQGTTQSFGTLAIAQPSTPHAPRARISGLALSPPTFAPVHGRGASIAARARGTTVSYRDSQSATTTLTVQRAAQGRRAGGTCQRPGRRNRRRARCTRYLRVGSFAHRDVAGANRFRFTGRIGGRALTPGRYRVQAVPRTSAGSGPAVNKSFEVTR